VKTLCLFASLMAAALVAGCATAPAAAPEVDLNAYGKVLIEPFTMAARLPGQDPQVLAGEFRDAFVAEFKDSSMLASTPGRDVLRVRVTVTELNRANPAVNVLTAALLFVPLDSGGASITMELRDAETGRLLQKREQRWTSTPLKIKGSFSAYGQATAAFGRWGKELSQQLAQKHAG
jgi:hypothetical protein